MNHASMGAGGRGGCSGQRIVRAEPYSGLLVPLVWSTRFCASLVSRDVIDGKRPHASRDLHQAAPTQAGHFEIQFVPTELRITSDQGFEVTFRRILKKSEDALSDGR